MDKKKVLIIVGGIAAVGTALYFIFKEDANRLFAKYFKGGEITGSDTKMGYVQENASVPSKDIIKPSVITTDHDKDINIAYEAKTTNYPGCPSYKTESFPLKKGMKGGYCANVQLALNKVYKKGLVTDGCFGPKTEAALQSVTGRTYVDANNYRLLFSAYLGSVNVSTIKYT
jgi:hypothetical protein